MEPSQHETAKYLFSVSKQRDVTRIVWRCEAEDEPGNQQRNFDHIHCGIDAFVKADKESFVTKMCPSKEAWKLTTTDDNSIIRIQANNARVRLNAQLIHKWKHSKPEYTTVTQPALEHKQRYPLTLSKESDKYTLNP